MKNTESKQSPFGGEAEIIESVEAGWFIQKYKDKTGLDISRFFSGIDNVIFCRCTETDFRYWLPESLAGDEEFYRALEKWSPFYYRENRWEYAIAKKFTKNKSVLEVGSGRGYFLRQNEEFASSALGLELNQSAIEKKVTNFDIQQKYIEDVAESGNSFDVLCSFQVLEHIPNPMSFLSSCRKAINSKGHLLVSTPNYSNREAQLRNDCLDLPPHHMGHYTEHTYKKLAEILDMELERIFVQSRGPSAYAVSPENENRFLWKLAKKAGGAIERAGYKALGETGHTILAVYRKREGG